MSLRLILFFTTIHNMNWQLYIWWVIFDSTLSSFWLFLNILAAFFLISMLWYAIYYKDKKNIISFFITFVWISAFELLTWALWKVQYLWNRAYWFWDISRILAIVRTWVLYRSDYIIQKTQSHQAIKTISITSVIIWLIVLWANIYGVISYEPETLASIDYMIWAFPINALYYIPIRIFITYSFKKYFDQAIFNNYHGTQSIVSIQNFLIVFVSVFCVELLIEPTLIIKNLPSRSFIYKDVSFLLTLSWTLIIAITAFLTNKFFNWFDLFIKFSYAIFWSTILWFLFLSFLIQNHIIWFSKSVLQTHTLNSLYLGNTWLTTMTFISMILFFMLIIPTSKYRTNNKISKENIKTNT